MRSVIVAAMATAFVAVATNPLPSAIIAGMYLLGKEAGKKKGNDKKKGDK